MAPIPTPIGYPTLTAGLHSSARYAAPASVRGLLVAGIQVFVSYRIHPSIHLAAASAVVVQCMRVYGRDSLLLLLLLCMRVSLFCFCCC